jgi:hypothetical protein
VKIKEYVMVAVLWAQILDPTHLKVSKLTYRTTNEEEYMKNTRAETAIFQKIIPPCPCHLPFTDSQPDELRKPIKVRSHRLCHFHEHITQHNLLVKLVQRCRSD